MSRLGEWIANKLIADDPYPEYSRLDRMDGLVEQPSGLLIDPERFAEMARKVNP